MSTPNQPLEPADAAHFVLGGRGGPMVPGSLGRLPSAALCGIWASPVPIRTCSPATLSGGYAAAQPYEHEAVQFLGEL
jgi:hypothetical protein